MTSIGVKKVHAHAVGGLVSLIWDVLLRMGQLNGLGSV